VNLGGGKLKVDKLIELLQKCDPDKEVEYVSDPYHTGGTITYIRELDDRVWIG